MQGRHPQVTVVGRSLGSGIATRLASGAVAGHHFRWLPVRLLLRDRYDSAGYAPQVSAPTTILAAEHDEVIPRASSEALYRSFRAGLATFQVVPGVGHNDISLRQLQGH